MRTLTVRRWVMGISIMMLLLCQTAAAVLTYGFSYTAADDASPSCEQSALHTNGSAPEHGCQDRCASRYASLETAKVKIPAAINLALPVTIVDAPCPCLSLTPRYERIVANAAPPPLILVYGRLLI